MKRMTSEQLTTDYFVSDMIKRMLEFDYNETFIYHNMDFSKVIYVSSAYEKILGGSIEHLCNEPFSFLDFVLDEDKERLMLAHHDYLKSQRLDLVIRVKDKEGNILWFHAITKPVIEDGGIVGHLSRMRDVTNEKEHEIKVKRHQVYLDNILNTQNELVVRSKPDTTILYVNKAYCKIRGKSEEELLGIKYITFYPEEQHQNVFEMISSLSVEKPQITNLFQFEKSDRELLWIKWTEHGVFDDQGNLVEIISTGIDVSLEKKLIQELEENNRVLQTAQINAKIGIYKVDLIGDSCRSSKVLNNILEIKSDEKKPMSVWEDLIHPDDKLRVLSTLDNIIKNNEPYHLRYRIITEENQIEKWIYDTGNIEYIDNHPVSIIGTMMDITELMKLEQKLEESYDDLEKAYKETIKGWAQALSLKDDETEEHSQRVTKLSLDLAKKMDYPNSKLNMFEYGAILHDIGKIGVSEDILLKAGKLTTEEFDEIKKHPIYAFNMLSQIEYLRDAIDIPYCHHEKWDGTGYPNQLKGESIPLAARIFAIVDVYDALTNDRCYRKAWEKEKTLQYLRDQSGIHFDPEIVECFLEII